jgi:hypothetical protein
MGFQWISHETSADKVRFPNLYFGTEAPEYMVLKFFPGEVILQRDEMFQELYAGIWVTNWRRVLTARLSSRSKAVV